MRILISFKTSQSQRALVMLRFCFVFIETFCRAPNFQLLSNQ